MTWAPSDKKPSDTVWDIAECLASLRSVENMLAPASESEAGGPSCHCLPHGAGKKAESPASRLSARCHKSMISKSHGYASAVDGYLAPFLSLPLSSATTASCSLSVIIKAYFQKTLISSFLLLSRSVCYNCKQSWIVTNALSLKPTRPRIPPFLRLLHSRTFQGSL